MRNIFIIVSLIGMVFTVDSQTYPELYRNADQGKMNHWVDSVFKKLSIEEQIGQLFMVVVDPKSDARNMQLAARYQNEIKIGGILFQKGDPVTQAEVTNELQKTAKVPMLISLDGEWGLSMRLSNTTRFPKNMILGAIEDNNLITLYGEEVARQCKELGIHINFAPCLDVNSNTANPVIGIRSFGEDPHAVAEKGVAYAKGLESLGVLSVAKHFPGHGDTAEDSHHTLPALRHDILRLDSIELYPFKRYIYDGFAGIMTAHLYIPALDNTAGRPSSFSKAVVTDLLQNNLGFRGLAFTDGLAMKGASSNTADNPCVLALQAGNDILLGPASPFNDYKAVVKAVNEGLIKNSEIEEKCRKVLQYKYIAGLNKYKPIELKGLEQRLNSPHAAWMAAKLNAESITLLKNQDDILPLKELDKRKIAVLTLGEGTDNDFQKRLGMYDKVDKYTLTRNSTAAQVQQVYNKLQQYDLIICGIHTVRIPESAELRQLAAKKDMVLAFFTLPYFCKQYKQSISHAKAVVMGYETTPLAQDFAAQGIFGGIALKGKLPVTIPELYFAGTGIFTSKTRLGYHEPEEVGANPARMDVIDSIVEEGLKNGAYPGCQVLVAKDGVIIYNKSFGYFDSSKKKKVDATAVYDIASASKAAGTLLGVMKGYDNSAYTLTTPAADYIPELKETDKKGITIKDLLFHQSGMVAAINFYLKAIDKKSYQGNLYASAKDANHPVQYDKNTWVRTDYSFFPELVSKTEKEGFNMEVAQHFYLNNTFRDSIMQQIADSKLSNQGKYRYSCINFIVLQKMLENRLNQPLDKLLYTEYYNRLGAKDVRYTPLKWMDGERIVPTEDDRFLRKQLLKGYVHDEAAAFQGGVSGNAGLFSSSNDLAKILQMLLNQGVYGGEEYLSPETVRLFTQTKSPVSRRGLGFDKPDTGNLKSSPCGSLTPASVYGHTGYTGTCFWVDPDNQLVYIFLSNRVNPTRLNTKLFTLNIRTRIQDAIYKAIDKKSQKD
ncbi:MAG: serine hydrolase [Tannerellaceae bacterium]|nr:serine hydrolase [Tannerellaceae bacterium]